MKLFGHAQMTTQFLLKQCRTTKVVRTTSAAPPTKLQQYTCVRTPTKAYYMILPPKCVTFCQIKVSKLASAHVNTTMKRITQHPTSRVRRDAPSKDMFEYAYTFSCIDHRSRSQAPPQQLTSAQLAAAAAPKHRLSSDIQTSTTEAPTYTNIQIQPNMFAEFWYPNSLPKVPCPSMFATTEQMNGKSLQ
jgi:hypothetical protein